MGNLRRDPKGRLTTSPATSLIRHNFFSGDDPQVLWLAGLIAADGSISKDGKRWRLALSGEASLALIEHVRRLVGHTLAVSAYQPPRGRRSYGISVGSAQMIEDLHRRFRIRTSKTLTYGWPALSKEEARPFIRGYVDGDGCIGTYPTPQNEDMLHLSFVGTPDFVAGARAEIPADGRLRVIDRCKSLVELRFNGRFAWAACSWLYQDESLFLSTKLQVFHAYQQVIMAKPPRWLLMAKKREIVTECIKQGMSVSDAAAAAGVHWRTVYQWVPITRA